MAAGQIATRVAPVTSSFFFPLLSFLYIYIYYFDEIGETALRKRILFVCLFDWGKRKGSLDRNEGEDWVLGIISRMGIVYSGNW